jgi:hypothetical protein
MEYPHQKIYKWISGILAVPTSLLLLSGFVRSFDLILFGGSCRFSIGHGGGGGIFCLFSPLFIFYFPFFFGFLLLGYIFANLAKNKILRHLFLIYLFLAIPIVLEPISKMV